MCAESILAPVSLPGVGADLLGPRSRLLPLWRAEDGVSAYQAVKGQGGQFPY